MIWGKVAREGRTFLDFGFLHLVTDLLLEVALVVVGELGDVEVGGG